MSMNDKNSPYAVPVKAGSTTYICRCGATKNPPFCDGSHANVPDKQPHAHTASKDATLYVCGCGRSKNGPWCDGSHNS